MSVHMCSSTLCAQLANCVCTVTMPSYLPPGIATMSTAPPLNDQTPSISEPPSAEEAVAGTSSTARTAPRGAHRAGRAAWKIRLIGTCTPQLVALVAIDSLTGAPAVHFQRTVTAGLRPEASAPVASETSAR